MAPLTNTYCIYRWICYRQIICWWQRFVFLLIYIFVMLWLASFSYGIEGKAPTLYHIFPAFSQHIVSVLYTWWPYTMSRVCIPLEKSSISRSGCWHNNVFYIEFVWFVYHRAVFKCSHSSQCFNGDLRWTLNIWHLLQLVRFPTRNQWSKTRYEWLSFCCKKPTTNDLAPNILDDRCHWGESNSDSFSAIIFIVTKKLIGWTDTATTTHFVSCYNILHLLSRTFWDAITTPSHWYNDIWHLWLCDLAQVCMGSIWIYISLTKYLYII